MILGMLFNKVPSDLGQIGSTAQESLFIFITDGSDVHGSRATAEVDDACVGGLEEGEEVVVDTFGSVEVRGEDVPAVARV